MSRRRFFDDEALARRLPDRVYAEGGEVLEHTLLSNHYAIQRAKNSVDVSVDGLGVQKNGHWHAFTLAACLSGETT